MAEYINREKILEDIGTDIAPFTLSMVFRHIRNAPPADVAEVKHGKWEYIGTDKKGYVYRCSNCAGRIGLDYETNYCPNCGAKMDLEG